MKYKIILFIIISAVLMSFCSCGSSDADYSFKFAVEGNPKTLDPQCALNDSSRSVFAFVFKGLFVMGDNGEISKGMIDSYTVSDDGTVWTFYLESDVMWSDGRDFSSECTANDYVFAFQRLFKPATKSKRAEEYYIIKNAEKINTGVITDISQLGVRAVDNLTLEITLEMPCSDFEAMLALPPAMPCNEEFFNRTEGRYGLAEDCVASNSGYYVHTWSYDEWSNESNYIILRRNKLNAYSESSPYSVNLFISPVNELKDFDEEVLKAYRGKNTEEISELKKQYQYLEYETGVWGLIFNLNGEFSNQSYRLNLVSNADFSSDDDRYTVCNNIIPLSVSFGEGLYRDLAGELNEVSAVSSNVGVLGGMKMIMPQGTSLRADIGKILQNWQAECGFYCSITELETEEYQSALENGNFDIALIKLSGEYNSPYAYLNDFLIGNSLNYGGYDSLKYAHIINSALTSVDSDTAAVYYKEAEQLLIDSGVFLPLCTEMEYIFHTDEVGAIGYNPFSGVYIVKE